MEYAILSGGSFGGQVVEIAPTDNEYRATDESGVVWVYRRFGSTSQFVFEGCE